MPLFKTIYIYVYTTAVHDVSATIPAVSYTRLIYCKTRFSNIFDVTGKLYVYNTITYNRNMLHATEEGRKSARKE